MKNLELLESLKNYKPTFTEEIESKNKIIEFISVNEVILGKRNINGHITGSAWIVNKDRSKVLLTHHSKLDKWLQLGGHTEEDETVFVSALREAEEESGLCSVRCLSQEIFDVDVHVFPERKGEKEHIHYDIRFLFEADGEEEVVISNESKDVKWIDIDKVEMFSKHRSIIRMVEKTYNKYKIT